MKALNSIKNFAARLGLIIAVVTSVNGATLTWDADPATPGAQDGSGTWSHSANNWWTGTANALWSSTTPDAAIFGAGQGVAGTVTLGESIVCGNITFNAPQAGWYTIAGGGYTLALTNVTITPNTHATIAANLVGPNVTIANVGGVLTISGNSSVTGTFRLGPNAANTTCAVRATSSDAFGQASPILLNDQGNQSSPRIELIGGITITNRIQLPGRNNVSSAFISVNGNNTLSGPITNQAGGVWYIFQSEGTSSLNLAGPYQIQPTGGRTIVFRGTGNGLISGVILGGQANSPTNTIVKAGSGTWTISGTNNYIAPAVVAEGTLQLDYSAGDTSKLSDLMPVYFVGGKLDLRGGTHVEVISSNIVGVGSSVVIRSSGSAILRQNAIQRLPGGVIDFAAAGIADTDTPNVHGILGGYATVGGADWAINSTGAADGAIGVYTGYTDIAATGSTISDNAAANVRLNSAGSGGNIALGATTTTINTLLQNTTTPATIDTSDKTLRLGVTGGVLVPSGKQSLTIGTSANAGTLTAGGADNIPGEIILINNSANPLTVNSTIADNGSGLVALTVAGSGSVTLNGSNTHTGTNYICSGTLNISSALNLGSGPVVINGGTLNLVASMDLSDRLIFLGPQVGFGTGTIRVAAGQTATINTVIANNVSGLINPSVGAANSGILGIPVSATLVKTGEGTLVLGGGNTYSLGTIVKEGALRISSAGNLGPAPGCYIPDNIVLDGGTLEADGTFELGAVRGILLGPVNGSGAGTISVTEGNTLTVSGRVSDNWNGNGSLTKTGPGTMVLNSGLNDYSGNTIVSAGTLQVGNSRAIPNGPGKGSLLLNGALDLNGYTVAVNGLSGTGIVDNTSFNPSTIVIGYTDASSSFSGTIQNSAGPLSLTKVGSGTLTLSGQATHSGSTIVSGGTLVLTGSATLSVTTNIFVSAGATLNASGLAGGLTLGYNQVISGGGAVLGSITAGSGAAVSPGGPGAAGTLTLTGNLTLNGADLNYDLGTATTPGAGVNDLLVVTGTLTVSGATALNLSYLQGVPASAGKYTLIQYGSFSGNVNNISVPAGFVITNNTVAKAIELIVVHEPVTLTWQGDGVANVWDTGVTANWLLGGSSAVFYTGDTAVFTDTGYNSPPINISGTVFPSATVVNAAQDYTFAGGTIGSGSLLKSGSGTLVLENDNVFSTGIEINGGTVQVGNGGFSGTLTGSVITNNAALVYARGDDALEVTNSITGSGSVTQAGSGGLTISSSNSYAGLTTVSAGILHVRNDAALGATNAGTVVANGAQLYIDRNVNITNEALSVSGGGPDGTTGGLRKGGAGLTTFAGPVTLSADTIVSVDGGATLALTEVGGLGSLTKDGSGALALLGPNTSAGIASVNNGELIIGHRNALGPTTNLVVYTTAGGAGITGTRITVANGTTVSNVQVNLPSDASYRSALFSRGTGGVTNVWAGPVAFAGYEGTINFGTEPGAVFVINGPVTNEAFTGVLLLRGTGGGGTSGAGCTGIISRPIIFDATTARVGVDDGSTWVFASTGSSFRTVNITSGVLKLGTNNALPTVCDLTFGMGGVAAETFDLAGFSQQLGSITTLSTTARLIGNSSTTSDSMLTLAGAYSSTFGGVIQDTLGEGTRRVALTLTGGAVLTLTNVNTYSGDTTINSGCTLLLANEGSIANSANIFIGAGAAVDATGKSDGTLTVSGVQTLKGNGTFNVNGNLVNLGTIEMKVNKTGGSLTGDLLNVNGNVTYGGTLQIVASGGPYALGDSIQLFQVSGTKSGNFTLIGGSPGPGLSWGFNPATGIASVIAGLPTTTTNISYSVTATNITISWPSSHIGWILQVQTNPITKGISTNWVDVPGSAGTNRVVFPIGTTDGTVFFRLRYP